MVNNEWFWEEPGDYRERVMNISSNMILAEIATSLHEIAQQLAEANGYVGPSAPVLTESPMVAVHTAAPVTGQSFH